MLLLRIFDLNLLFVMRINLILTLFVFPMIIIGQRTSWSKCSQILTQQLKFKTYNNKETFNCAILVSDVDGFTYWATSQPLKIIKIYKPASIIIVEDQIQHFIDHTLHCPFLQYADISYNKAREEILIPGHNLVNGNINYVHYRYPELNGNGINISIKEDLFDLEDVDLQNRIILNPNQSTTISQHATIMSTWIAGAGNAGPQGKGVARGAMILSSDYANLLPDNNSEYKNFGITIQNHSYGIDIDNSYGLLALAYDKSAYDNPTLLHVFSSGNSGNEISPNGKYSGIIGSSNLTGNFKNSKNTLVVGSVDDHDILMSFSSRGPAYDGRIKPEIVAYGPDGTSGASAIVSGATALLQQAFLKKFGKSANSELIKAILICSSDDLGDSGPDFGYGYGRLNIKGAIELINNHDLETGTINSNEDTIFEITIPENINEFKFALSWRDPPALPAAPIALVNDLDIIVIDPNGNQHQPWILNTKPYKDSLILPATRGIDSLNNIECITIHEPISGKYKIIISAKKLISGSQEFALASYFQDKEKFDWIFPLRGDLLEATQSLPLNWSTNIFSDSSKLHWKPCADSTWRNIGTNINFKSNSIRWTIPDTFCIAQLRFVIGTQTYISDTFIISKIPKVNVNINCPDSIQLSWSGVNQSAIYELWGLGDKYLEPLIKTSDTTIILQRIKYPYKRFAISIIEDKSKIYSSTGLAPDPELQGVGCYINYFLAERIDDSDKVKINLKLGSLHGVNRIKIIKLISGSWIDLYDEDAKQLEINYNDYIIAPGANRYRAILKLNNDQIIESEIITVWFSGLEKFLVFPIPVHANEVLSILSELSLTEVPNFTLFNTQGCQILSYSLVDLKTDININQLNQGLYHWIIKNEKNQIVRSGNLMVIP